MAAATIVKIASEGKRNSGSDSAPDRPRPAGKKPPRGILLARLDPPEELPDEINVYVRRHQQST
jgi:hypothetical protein